MFCYRMPGQQQEEDLTDGADSAKKENRKESISVPTVVINWRFAVGI